MNKRKASVAIGSLVLMAVLTGCTALGDHTAPKSLDGVSSATTASQSETSTKAIWQTLDEASVKKLFEDQSLKGVFLWSNSKENLVVADPEGINLPFVWQETQNAVSLKTLGYPLVTASPKALVSADPDFILLMLPKEEAGRLEAVEQDLKETLSGKALAKVTRDHFYVWLYEPKSK